MGQYGRPNLALAGILVFSNSQVLLPCNMLLCTEPLHSLPLTFSDIYLLVSNGLPA